jgi:hypothetical protein
MSQPHFEASVRMRLALPKVGTWSPSGLPKLQSSIVGVKTPCLEVFFIPLESSWSVNVKNGLAWAIWASSAQVMVERKVGPGVKLAVWLPTTKKSGIDPTPVCAGGVRHTVGKLSRRATSLLQTSSQLEVWAPKIPGVQTEIVSGFLFGSLGTKKPFECGCRKTTQRILYGGRW